MAVWTRFRPLSPGEQIRRRFDTLARHITTPEDLVIAMTGVDPQLREELGPFLERRMPRRMTDAQRAWVIAELQASDAAAAAAREFKCSACPHTWRGITSKPQACPECGADGMLVLGETPLTADDFEAPPDAQEATTL